MSESGKVFRGGKYPRVPGDSAKNTGVLVLHFSLDDAMAEAAIVGGRRDLRANFLRGIESCIDHAQRSEKFALAKSFERFVGEPFQRNALRTMNPMSL